MLIGVTVSGPKKVLKFKGDTNLKVLLTKEQRQLGGGKFCVSFLSDGTASVGHFDSNGQWKFVLPRDANDVFNLENDLMLAEQPVFVGGQKRAILQQKFDEVCTKIHLDELTLEEEESRYFKL